MHIRFRLNEMIKVEKKRISYYEQKMKNCIISNVKSSLGYITVDVTLLTKDRPVQSAKQTLSSMKLITLVHNSLPAYTSNIRYIE